MRLSPQWLYVSAGVCVALYVGGLQSEDDRSRNEDPNVLLPILAVLAPLLLLAAVSWSIARATRRGPASGHDQANALPSEASEQTKLEERDPPDEDTSHQPPDEPTQAVELVLAQAASE